MTKKRIIGMILVKGKVAVQSFGFQRYLPIGRPEIIARYLDDWGIDEIILLDIDAAKEGRVISPNVVQEVSQNCFVPVTAGGGITTAKDVRESLSAGADKIAINSMAFDHLGEVGRLSYVYGRQCIVAVIDVQKTEDGSGRIYRHTQRDCSDITPQDWARELEQSGVGEILIHSVDKDGTLSGFDMDLVAPIADVVKIPLIVAGGAGHPDHFRKILDSDYVSAAAAGNYFNHSEHCVAVTKRYLIQHGIDVRFDSLTEYESHALEDRRGRIVRLDDAVLAEMVFQKIVKEVI
ncbi:HisA/HisF-related TIM barrel protein [Magnetovibrio sp. PR-2]|uniref:imidazole glycerol phosphate synthase subunit HisF n=1 Tax=Magnetovibrio sp. PR-2 TaxID=3120356 RepID=UPI002FCE39FF